MRLRSVVISGFIMMLISTLYVHQHAEIYKAGYALQQDRETLALLVDINSDLMYDLSSMETPRYLLASLRGMEIEFAGIGRQREDTYSIAGLYQTGDSHGGIYQGRALDIFTATAEADDRI